MPRPVPLTDQPRAGRVRLPILRGARRTLTKGNGRVSGGSARHGAAIVELAVSLPILVLITLGTIEACVMIHLKQTLAVAAFEGARVGMVPGSESSNVSAQCQLVLDDHEVVNSSITMSPSDPRNLAPGDFFRVTVTAECAANSIVGGFFYAGKTFSESAELAF